MKQADDPTPTCPPDRPADAETNMDQDRRDALARLGALAAWTAPSLLTLVTSARANGFGSEPFP